MSGETELLAILKEVSRSFYLSVGFLPAGIRRTIALAYLLARASDTVADTNQLPALERLDIMDRFAESLADSGKSSRLDLAKCVTKQAEGSEKILLANIDRVFEAFSALKQTHRDLVVQVLRQIIFGQSLDIRRFEIQPGIHALRTDAELEEYTYLVAGCVGEFWTKVCLLEWPRYARLPDGRMVEIGRSFGKGLQLVNILRDFADDLRNGRCYLPLPDPVPVARDPGIARAEWERWRFRAEHYLEQAWKYVCAVRPPRVRFACAMPVLIGIRTLQRLERSPQIVPGIKVSRREVHRMTIWAAGVALCRFLEPRVEQVFFRDRGAAP